MWIGVGYITHSSGFGGRGADRRWLMGLFDRNAFVSTPCQLEGVCRKGYFCCIETLSIFSFRKKTLGIINAKLGGMKILYEDFFKTLPNLTSSKYVTLMIMINSQMSFLTQINVFLKPGTRNWIHRICIIFGHISMKVDFLNAKVDFFLNIRVVFWKRCTPPLWLAWPDTSISWRDYFFWCMWIWTSHERCVFWCEIFGMSAFWYERFRINALSTSRGFAARGTLVSEKLWAFSFFAANFLKKKTEIWGEWKKYMKIFSKNLPTSSRERVSAEIL